jgi:methylated-DNA-protein-cysteine methyltransferase-like protein
MKFRESVINFIKKIPKGKVVSYGQVAAAAGSPRASRQAGSILMRLTQDDGQVPWWRVVNNKGIISIKGNWEVTKELQKEMLTSEGVKVDLDFKLDIEKYRFKN